METLETAPTPDDHAKNSTKQKPKPQASNNAIQMDTSTSKTMEKKPSGTKRQHQVDSDNGFKVNPDLNTNQTQVWLDDLQRNLMRKNFEINLIMLENFDTTFIYIAEICIKKYLWRCQLSVSSLIYKLILNL